MENSFIQVVPDTEPDSTQSDEHSEPWLIAIIDDEESVHKATRLSLKNATVMDRSLEFISAYSAADGEQLLKSNPNVALVLLDVVMETEDAGLRLVKVIREDHHNQTIQIILRTGQPGCAPEEQVIAKYGINSYKTKSELTRTKLFNEIFTALRGYSYMSAMERSRDGLKAIVEASASLTLERSVSQFASGVLKQIDALFNINANSLFCVSERALSNDINSSDDSNSDFVVIATSDEYQPFFGKNLGEISDNFSDMHFEVALKSLKSRANIFTDQCCCLYLSTPSNWQGVIVYESRVYAQAIDTELLQLFCSNVSLGLENARFFSHLKRALSLDALTGLSSRTGFGERLLERWQSATSPGTVYVLDIDEFHHFTDALGFPCSDQILKDMGSYLRKQLGDEAIIARLHSDVFAAYSPRQDLSPAQLAKDTAECYASAERPLRLSITAGSTSACPELVVPDPETLLREAEIAMKVAKSETRGAGLCFSQDYLDACEKSLMVISDLRAALGSNQLYFALQPKVNIDNSEIIGYEALIRWKHPVRGEISPCEFIPIVEKSGLHYALDMHVAREACALLNANLNINVPISINISANSLTQDSFASDLYREFEQASVELSRVELEITEYALINSDNAMRQIEALRSLGFMLCLDDFGSGFSSLKYLLELPLQTIKIDQAFVASIVTSSNAACLLKRIIQIGEDLDIKLIVEGVETKEQADILQELGVKYVQGYFYYPPMDVEAGVALMA